MSSKRMLAPEKDRLAAQVMERWAEFQESLSSQKRSYPTGKFEVFWNAAKRYAELTRSDPLIHRAVAAAVNGLVDFLDVERKRVPADVLRDAERLECLLFNGYDPYFEGDESHLRNALLVRIGRAAPRTPTSVQIHELDGEGE
jgi:hypothetical protein